MMLKEEFYLTWKKDSVGVRLRFEPKFLLVFIFESFQCFRFLFCCNIQINHCGMKILMSEEI